MFEIIDVFVRFTRSLAYELSIRDLGFDPTVRVLSSLGRLDTLPPLFLLEATNH